MRQFILKMMKRMRFGTKLLAFQKRKYLNLARKITSGNMVLVHVGHVLRFFMTVVKSTVVALLTVLLDVNVIDLSKFGIMCLLSLTVMAMVITKNFKIKTLIQVWVLKD